MDYEKQKRYIINAVYILIILALVMFVFRYAIFWMMPFVLAFAVAFLLKPLINGIVQVTHAKRRPVAGIIVLLFYGTVGVLLAYGLFLLISNLQNFVLELPTMYADHLKPALIELYNGILGAVQSLNPDRVTEIEMLLEELATQFSKLLTTVSSTAVGVVSQTALSVPAVFVSVLVTIISSFFISMDYYRITNFIVGQFSEKNQEIIMDAKDSVVKTVFQMIKSYSRIITITFVELSAGFWMLGIENPILVAACIAMVDVMPVLGTGGVMVPWVLIELVMKNYYLAIGLFVVYLVVTIIRNIIEPKIVGNKVGVHPIVMLISLFMGISLFGPLGIIILPFIVIVVKNLNDTGKIHVYKNIAPPRPSWEVANEEYEQAAKLAFKEVKEQKEEELWKERHPSHEIYRRRK